MDVQERLTAEELARRDYLSASHVHRYAIAAALSDGARVLDLGCGTGYGAGIVARTAASVHGVDIDEQAVAAARDEHGDRAVTFEASDALRFLQRTETGQYDVVVMFEALEHVPDPEAVLSELERLAAYGARLLVSVPNSRAFHEDNPFHVTDFGYAEARRAFRRFGDVTWLRQYFAEGSLILPDVTTQSFEGQVEALEQAEPEYANTYVAAIGFEADKLEVATARLNLVATPNHNRYMLELEQANADLRRANRSLARGIYGKHDAAAAVVVARLEAAAVAEREARNAAEAHLREVERALHQEWAWRDAARYRAADWVVRTIARVPGLEPALKALLRFVRRLRSGRASAS